MKLPSIIIVAAMTPKRVIGNNGTMPWKVLSDLKRFKKITTPGAVVMGPKTFSSIGRPLPGRFNIVITTNRKWEHPGVFTAHSAREALELAAVHGQHELYAIGGTSVYETFIPLAEQMFITLIQTDVEGDTHFPHYYDSDWYGTRHNPDWKLEPGDPVPTKLMHYRRIVR
ncbi:MAG: dhfrIII [Candidatus Adlerbacteria bacterium]|nr:dhfrIII [Candidatus Adlerbacteria bacterium]